MQILYILEKLRTPWLDGLMLALTELGSETAFLVVALVLFWCADKRKAYYLMSVGVVGTVASQFMKIACQIPRPWLQDPDFTIVEAAREGAGGYSFPSGHSQSGVGTFGAIAMTTHQKWLRRLCIAIMMIVPVTRMYLGVHTVWDVLVGSGLALVLLVALRPLCLNRDGQHLGKLFVAMAILSVVYLGYTQFYPFPADIDPANLHSASKNAYTLVGTMVGMCVGYFVDEKVSRFPTGGVWYAQAGKIIGGLVLVLLIKEGLKGPLDALCNGHLISRSIRYLLIVLTAGIVWPLSFPWFSRLGRADRK